MKKVILISGTDRSGSSLLDLMIGNSNNGFSCGELYRLFRPTRPIDILKNKKQNENKFEDKIIDFWSEIKLKGEKNVYNTLFESFKNVEFIVDSSKNPVWIRKQFKYNKRKSYELIPLISYKTPLEFAYSLFKRNREKYWKERWVNQHLFLFHVLEDFFTVKYSLLAKNPSAYLKLICKKIGIDYFEGKEKFWENKSMRYFLFGSETLRKSKKHIYYDSQYDASYLDFVKNSINTSDKIFDEILMILDAYEVGSKEKIDSRILEKKDEIKTFSLFNQLKFELETSKYYQINHFLYTQKKNAERLLSKINNYDNLKILEDNYFMKK